MNPSFRLGKCYGPLFGKGNHGVSGFAHGPHAPVGQVRAGTCLCGDGPVCVSCHLHSRIPETLSGPSAPSPWENLQQL